MPPCQTAAPPLRLQPAALRSGCSAAVHAAVEKHLVSQKLAARPTAPASPDEDVTVVAYAEEQITVRVRAAAPGVLVIADTWYPGWEAMVDGRPTDLRRVNLLFRGIPVEAGEHEVTLVYRPASWRTGSTLSLLGLALVGLTLLTTVFPSRGQGV